MVFLVEGLGDRQAQGPAPLGHTEAEELGGGFQEAHTVGEPQAQVGITQAVQGILPPHGGGGLEVMALQAQERRFETEVGRDQDHQLPPVAGASEDLLDRFRISDQVARQVPLAFGMSVCIMDSVPYTEKLCFRTPCPRPAPYSPTAPPEAASGMNG